MSGPAITRAEENALRAKHGLPSVEAEERAAVERACGPKPGRVALRELTAMLRDAARGVR